MNKRKDSPSLALTSQDVEGREARSPHVKRMSLTQPCQISIVKEVARRRRRLGTDLWKKVIRREHRATRTRE